MASTLVGRRPDLKRLAKAGLVALVALGAGVLLQQMRSGTEPARVNQAPVAEAPADQAAPSTAEIGETRAAYSEVHTPSTAEIGETRAAFSEVHTPSTVEIGERLGEIR